MPQGMTYGMRQNKRYITTLDEAGNSIVLASPELQYWDRGGYSLSRLYGLDTVPANIYRDFDVQKYLSSNGQQNPTSVMNKELVIEGGVSFIQGDFGPSSISPWHRTISVDFVTVVEGSFELEVGNDAKDCTKLTLNRGDSIIQRGTMHRWINPSSKASARFVATVSSCQPFQVGANSAEQIYLPKREAHGVD